MKQLLVFCLVLVMTLACLCPAALAAKEITMFTKCGTHGTAKRLNGRTAIVSVFASDSKVSWDFNRDKDMRRYGGVHEYLGIAARWIMDQAAAYNVHCELVWDWMEHNSLYRTHRFPGSMVTYDGFDRDAYISYIDSEIPTDDIMRELDAENILYMFFYNTPTSNPVGSYANPFYQLPDNIGGYEFVCLFTGEFNQVTTPGTYAHEMLHLFGVPDMYAKNDAYSMSAKFIKAYQKKYPRDIMAGAPTNKYDRVQFTFSPLVAYYAGLTRSCDLVDQWQLRKSDYELYGY